MLVLAIKLLDQEMSGGVGTSLCVCGGASRGTGVRERAALIVDLNGRQEATVCRPLSD